ncbi:MAG TPA: ABC transporter substrate-binding protein [Actinomycetota bacterium]|nr:ABC transporter substrate-binding protein [Actinomycetota bacterium]
MSRTFRSAASGAVAALLLAACPAAGPPPPEPPPAPAGVVRLAYPLDPPTLNPIRATTPEARDVLRALLPSFHVVTPDLRYRPSLLAEEPVVVVEGERMEVRFRIRDDARWSDGRPITVEDVAFTWQVMVHRRLDAPVSTGFEHLLGVERRGPKAGTLVFEPPFTGWRDLFSAGRFVLPARGRPADVAGWDDGPPVSGGPFVLERWVRGRSIDLARNPRAFVGPPLVQGIRLEIVPDATTALQLFEAGEVDALAPMLGLGWGSRLERLDGVDLSRATGPTQVHLLLHTGRLSRRRDRQSIAQALDRDRFADVVLRGRDRVAQSVLSPEQPGYLPAWAGYGGGGPVRVGRELRLVSPRAELLDLTARWVQTALSTAGADVDLVAVDPQVFERLVLRERDYELALWVTRSGPGPWLDRWFSSDSGERPSTWEDPTLDALLGRVGLGGPEGASALETSQQLLAQQAAVIPLFRPEVVMASRGVRGVEANPTADGPLWNAEAWAFVERPTTRRT